MSSNSKQNSKEHKFTYVWEMPVRVFHWVNALCIVVLIITGLLIGNPLAIQSGEEANFGYWFGIVRFLHFVFAFVFLFNGIYRIYWAFVGNKHTKWYNYIPLRGKQWKEIWEVLKIDIVQTSNKELETVGHNALAAFTYFVIFLAFLVQCFTGFGLYASMSTLWLPKLFSWIVPLLGGDLMTRYIHHITMWIFIIFTLIHVYLSLYHDYVGRRAIISSMISGMKVVETDEDE